MKRHDWFEQSARNLAMVIMIAIGSGGGGTEVLALGEISKITGFVMDVNKETATLEVERKAGDFVTLYLDREARWVLSKVEVGDHIHATIIIDQGDRLKVKEISFQMGPDIQIDIVQGIVTKTNPRDHWIEVKTNVGTQELLYLDQFSLGILSKLTVGDSVEARAETVIEEGGTKKVVRTILIGKGP